MFASIVPGVQNQKKPWFPRKRKPSEEKFVLKLPYNNDPVVPKRCEAITYSYGLLIQCDRNKIGASHYCNNHQDVKGTQYGTIHERCAVGMYDYSVMVKGKEIRPIRYSEYMNKHQVEKVTVQEVARKKKIRLHEAHFVGLFRKLGGETEDVDQEIVTDVDADDGRRSKKSSSSKKQKRGNEVCLFLVNKFIFKFFFSFFLSFHFLFFLFSFFLFFYFF
jgi:hypothetical protein